MQLTGSAHSLMSERMEGWRLKEEDEDCHRNHSPRLCPVCSGGSPGGSQMAGKALLETDLASSCLTPPCPESEGRSRATPSSPSNLPHQQQRHLTQGHLGGFRMSPVKAGTEIPAPPEPCTCAVASAPVQLITIVAGAAEHPRQVLAGPKDTDVLEGALINVCKGGTGEGALAEAGPGQASPAPLSKPRCG